jgi:hypothetical protein
MTVFKLALANLGMWVRERYFPTSYAKCGWSRLLLFFELGGWVSQGVTVVKVNLQPFNDRALNRDLAQVCELVNAGGLVLPDGRHLRLGIEGAKVGQRESCAISKAVPTPFPVSLYSAIAKVG